MSTFDEALAATKLGKGARHSGMGDGWLMVGTQFPEPGFRNPVTGIVVMFTVNEKDRARTDWTIVEPKK